MKLLQTFLVTLTIISVYNYLLQLDHITVFIVNTFERIFHSVSHILFYYMCWHTVIPGKEMWITKPPLYT